MSKYLNPHFWRKYPHCGGTASCKGLHYNVRIYYVVNHTNSLNMPTKWNIRINPSYCPMGKILQNSSGVIDNNTKYRILPIYLDISFVKIFRSRCMENMTSNQTTGNYYFQCQIKSPFSELKPTLWICQLKFFNLFIVAPYL